VLFYCFAVLCTSVYSKLSSTCILYAVRKLKSHVLLQSNFQPDVVTQAVGRELARTSFLGPFLSVSVFAEEVADKFFSGNPAADKSSTQTLQQELENTRVSSL